MNCGVAASRRELTKGSSLEAESCGALWHEGPGAVTRGTRNRVRPHFWTVFWRAGAPEPLVKAQSADQALVPDPAWCPLSTVCRMRGVLPLPHPAGRQVLLSRLL